MRFDLRAVVLDQVDGFGHFGDGLEAVLADLHAHQRGNLVLALHQDVGGFAQQADAFLPADIAPAGEGGPGGGNGFLGVGSVALLELAEQDAGVSGRGVVEGAVLGLLCLSVDVHGVGFAQFFAHVTNGRVEGVVELVAQVGERGVGDFLHGCSYAFGRARVASGQPPASSYTK